MYNIKQNRKQDEKEISKQRYEITLPKIYDAINKYKEKEDKEKPQLPISIF